MVKARDRRLPYRILPIIPAALMFCLIAAAAARSEPPPRADPGVCRPTTWSDWHLAVRAQCVTRTYVCHNMTVPKLLQDPRVVEAYEDAIASNDRARLAEMDGLIGRIRDAYGCAAPKDRIPRGAAGAEPADAVPPGHPPVGGAPDGDDVEPTLDRTI